MARRSAVRRRRRVRRSNPRGYIRYRGRWIASAPYQAHGRVVRRRRRRARRYDDNPRRRVSRRRRRNPSGYIRIRRRWRPITRYARRSRRGRIRSFRFPRTYRRRRRARRYYDNPPRRRRVHRRRRYASNPRRYSRRRFRLLANPIDAIKSAIEDAFSMDTLETLFHSALGFGGTAVASRLLYKKVIPAIGESAIGRVATTFGTSVLGSGLLAMLTKNSTMATRFMAGGMLTTLWQLLSEILPDEAKEFVPTLGDNESPEFRRAIESEVLKELRRSGVSATDEGMSVYVQPAGVEEVYVTAAGTEAYLTERETERAGVSGYLTEREAEAAVAGVGEPYDEFSAKSLPERF